MLNRYSKIMAVLVGVAFAAGGATVYARQTSGDAAAIASARVPLAQAVAIAEQHVKGKAVKAEYEQTRQGWVYQVEVLGNGKAFDVRVDPARGSVLSSVEDKDDRDESDE